METVNILKKLLAINTENPPGNEGRLVKFIANVLKEAGFLVMAQSITPGRKNLIAYPGKVEDGILLLNAHLDTVPIGEKKEWKYSPLGEIVGQKIYGRGACDVKGAMATMISAAIKAKKRGIKNFILAFTADEESGHFLGAKTLIEKRSKFISNVKYGIIAEPTDLQIVTAHKGVVVIKVKFKGISAHGSSPEKGVNAIYKATKAIEEILAFNLKRDKSHFLLGLPTINVGKIYGGLKVNVVPENCEVELETRLVPPENPERILSDLKKICKKHQGKVQTICKMPPFNQAENSPLIAITKRILKKNDLPYSSTGVNFYTEAEIYKRLAGIECEVLGPGSPQKMHVTDEHIKIKDLKAAERIYFGIITNFC